MVLLSRQNGNNEAEYSIGLMYEEGRGVVQNYAQALEWFIKAASPHYNAGYAEAQLKLGLMYKNGLGVTQDNIQAVKWLARAATQNHSQALQEIQNIRQKALPAERAVIDDILESKGLSLE